MSGAEQQGAGTIVRHRQTVGIRSQLRMIDNADGLECQFRSAAAGDLDVVRRGMLQNRHGIYSPLVVGMGWSVGGASGGG
jgi:hypothetical protein